MTHPWRRKWVNPAPNTVQTPLEINAKPLGSFLLMYRSGCVMYLYYNCDFLLLASKGELYGPTHVLARLY